MRYNFNEIGQRHTFYSCRTMMKLGMLFILLALLVGTSCSSDKESAGNFKKQSLKTDDFGLFDMGVADINSDGRLDIFTANLSAPQSFMLNNGSGVFTDVFQAWKIDQDRQFPGLAVLPEEPPLGPPGVYINWVCPDLLVRAHQMDQYTHVAGSIEVLSAVEITKKQNFDVQVTTTELPSKAMHSIIRFSNHGSGYFSFKPYIHALPIQFHFDAGTANKKIFVGPKYVTPGSLDFAIKMRDRHGMAWTDFNNDGRMDVFITRGGLKGTMGNVPLPFWDELLLGTPDGMEDVGIRSGLAKNGCPGRQAAWVDFNGDGRLDLYVGCGRGKGIFPNQLFQQTSVGHFENVAEKVGLDIPTNGTFVWLDADLDGDMDLFWSDANGFTLYRNDAGTFVLVHLESQGRRGRSAKLTVSDYDNDGDLDIFSASPSGNVLFINAGGNFSAVMPLSIGLPDKSKTADWVDYDNDGSLDLHAVPNGLYIQKQKGKFVFSSQLKIAQNRFSPFKTFSAISNWFDMDNNGTRDLLSATEWGIKNRRWARWLSQIMGSKKRFGGLNTYWKTELFINKEAENHWLQVQLEGPPENRPAIGARVTLQTTNGSRMEQIGEADGSHFSQGHYRLYYGLGPHPGSLSLHVRWPDGKITEIAHPAIDRLLKIDWKNS
jgi:ASPIC and UnbV/FG-GAP-like repeat